MPVAVVTGGSRGIGRAIARRLADTGASVAVNYRTDRAAAAQVVTAIEARGGRALAFRSDITDPEQVRALFDSAEQTFGALDIVVSNAAIARFSPLAEATDDDFDQQFAINTKATFYVLREAANRLRDGGRIVLVSSGATITHRPGSGLYAAGKAASEQLVRVLARELAPRAITVDSVLPGAVHTDALAAAGVGQIDRIAATIPMGRVGEPDDIADIVGFLVSEEARWITGASIPASGGAF
ncbi:SDR family oxidoreductase [Nocardia sp. NPDC004568]|uniref:SDR family oxidoreductase n=1 Tax=Nocardia sp. NPDC004568 TaxID=3154551 RepID=UPI0033AC9432